MPVERLLQRLGLHHRGMQHRARCDRADAARQPFWIDMNDQLEPKAPRRRVAKFDHLAELPGRVDMEQPQRQPRGMERLARKVQQNARILAHRIEQYRVAELGRDLAQDRDRLRFEAPQMPRQRSGAGRPRQYRGQRVLAQIQSPLCLSGSGKPPALSARPPSSSVRRMASSSTGSLSGFAKYAATPLAMARLAHRSLGKLLSGLSVFGNPQQSSDYEAPGRSFPASLRRGSDKMLGAIWPGSRTVRPTQRQPSRNRATSTSAAKRRGPLCRRPRSRSAEPSG